MYPLKVGDSGRFLVDQSNEPVFMQGDSAWSLLTALDDAEADRYLADRQRKGFNSIWVGLIEHLFAPDPPRNRAGQEPFEVPGDFSTPGEPYFAHVDRVLRAAAERGIQVFLSPCYLGYPDPSYPGYDGRPEGWYDEVLWNGVASCAAYGRYVGRRYRELPNIVWVMGGDRCPGPALEHVRAMANGILAEDDRHVLTAHVHPECSPIEQYPGDPWLTLNMTYTYSIVHRALRRDYARRPILPNVLFETTYENEHNASDLQIRRQAYWALLSGACGQFMGNKPIWMFGDGWEPALDSPGARAMSHLRSLVDQLPWWDFVPDESHSIVTSGVGEFNGLDFCAVAATAAGDLVVAYLPTRREVAMDLRHLAGHEVWAEWFDPRHGTYRATDVNEPGGTARFTPPTSGDWVLLVGVESCGDGGCAAHEVRARPRARAPMRRS